MPAKLTKNVCSLGASHVASLCIRSCDCTTMLSIIFCGKLQITEQLRSWPHTSFLRIVVEVKNRTELALGMLFH